MRRRKLLALISLTTLYIATCTIYTYVSLKREKSILDNYQSFLLPHIWQLDMKNVKTIADNMFKSTDAVAIVIKDEYGEIFYKKEREINTFERAFLKLGIIWRGVHVYKLSYEGINVGEMRITVIRRYSYFYMYTFALFLTAFFALSAHLNLRRIKEELEKAREELENTVTELENTIEELESTEEQLVNAEKMASLGGL